ncbi:MAG: hypothetical protein A4S15_03500 [Candidatus Raskinella chloraquaticus]|uniref:Pseudouridine synthase RsuA/RluA-like domain-containing protein n=1 Tax=Candidatus Raskinella chloraquaticus TaxID=1951219 RepID=A0A1W9I547_9HYPH|nr:MAG: hypothetical protein A4S15_03500 [Proteobacteria bacterium SG_bin8]
MAVQQVTVGADEADVRLDRWFRRHYPGLSHGALEKLLRTGQVRLDGRRARAAQRLRAGEILRLPPQMAMAVKPRPMRTTPDPARAAYLRELILFEDADVVAINKPAGLAVQGGTGIRESLDDWLPFLAREGGGRPKLVHRLDRETSGVLIIARTALAATKLTEAFRLHTAKKVYWALTLGVPKPLAGEMVHRLMKEGEQMVVRDHADAQRAETAYRVLDHAGRVAALVALAPKTGRTHQLRVQLAAMNCPILGDPVYAEPKAEAAAAFHESGAQKGMHLHALRLTVPHPRKGVIAVEAPVPKAFRQSLSALSLNGDTAARVEDEA